MDTAIFLENIVHLDSYSRDMALLSRKRLKFVEPVHQGIGTYPKPFPRFQTNKRRSMTFTMVTISLVHAGSPSSSELRNRDKRKNNGSTFSAV